MKLPVVNLYTDGSYIPNINQGGCCANLQYGIHEITVVYGEKNTTNNRMEMTAVIIGLNILKVKCKVKLFSDSKYVINAFKDKWIINWKKNNWKSKVGTDIKNKDLWLILDELVKRHDVEFNWVKGHASNEKNNYCDEVAKDVARNGKRFEFI